MEDFDKIITDGWTKNWQDSQFMAVNKYANLVKITVKDGTIREYEYFAVKDGQVITCTGDYYLVGEIVLYKTTTPGMYLKLDWNDKTKQFENKDYLYIQPGASTQPGGSKKMITTGILVLLPIILISWYSTKI